MVTACEEIVKIHRKHADCMLTEGPLQRYWFHECVFNGRNLYLFVTRTHFQVVRANDLLLSAQHSSKLGKPSPTSGKSADSALLAVQILHSENQHRPFFSSSVCRGERLGT